MGQYWLGSVRVQPEGCNWQSGFTLVRCAWCGKLLTPKPLYFLLR